MLNKMEWAYNYVLLSGSGRWGGLGVLSGPEAARYMWLREGAPARIMHVYQAFVIYLFFISR